MKNFDRAFSVNYNGVSLDDEVGIFTGVGDPNTLLGSNTYPVGSIYIRQSNGSLYQKAIDNVFYVISSSGSSIDSQSFTFNCEKLADGKWMGVGVSNDIRSGHIMHSNGTITSLTVHVSKSESNTKTIEFYKNNSVIHTEILPNTDNSITIKNTNIPVITGDKIRVFGKSGGKIKNVTATISVVFQ